MAKPSSDTMMSVFEVAQLLRLSPAELVAARRRARENQPTKPKRAPRPSQQAVARYRKRQRLGQVVLKVVVPEYEIACFLIDSGRLAETDTIIRSKVEEACSQVLLELAQR